MKSGQNKRMWAKVITAASVLAFSFCLLSLQVPADSPLKEGGFAAPTGKKTSQYVAGEILVKFKSVATEKDIGSLNSIYKTSVLYTSPYAGFKKIKIFAPQSPSSTH